MTRNEKLLFLAAALENDADDPAGMKFDLRAWLADQAIEQCYVKPVALGFVPKRSCGTTGCAIGLACLLPEFQAMGLAMKLPLDHPSYPTYKGDHSEKAVANFFEVEQHDVHYLFWPSSYVDEEKTGRVGELAVATRIRKFVINPSYREV